VHNTVTVDDLDQMERGPRFLWFGWIKSQVRYRARTDQGRLEYFEGEHYGYTRLSQPVTHRRAIVRAGDGAWLVVDDMLGRGVHRFRLHWLLPDLEYDLDEGVQHLVLHTDQGGYGVWCACHAEGLARLSLVRGRGDGTTRGWQSPYYSVRSPALSLALEAACPVPCRFVTLFAPVPETAVDIRPTDRVVVRMDHHEGLIQLSPLEEGTRAIVQDIALMKGVRTKGVNGKWIERLQISGEMEP
jgi:hypothetical protein